VRRTQAEEPPNRETEGLERARKETHAKAGRDEGATGMVECAVTDGGFA
jgi:hypothetical protein